LAAKYADEFNAAFRSAADAEASFGRVRDACSEAGRDPASIAFSAAHVVCCGKDEAELARRAASIGRELPELRKNGLAGSPSEIVDKIGEFAAAGATTFYLQILDLADLDQLELLASQVLPHV
jgi:alkanesulfonate monooxygenase SsuD/methylene tetrahydromethanopterin reductase-like flavin-dependent oxidoreductase (luciferase family)